MLSDELDDWEMLFADSAAAALELLRESDVDVVVSDVNMPVKDGFTLLSELQGAEETRDIPVIILTGREETDIKRRALELGAIDLLNKPVQPEDLIARLRSAVRLKEYQHRLKNHNAMLERKVEERTAELMDSRMEIIWRLGAAAEYRDQETGEHVIRVACYCRALGHALGLDRDRIEMLFLASPLHDIGKIGIPDRILLKRGALTPAEWETMKGHCAIGARILREESRSMRTFFTWHRGGNPGRPPGSLNPMLEMASSIAMSHHERWDGSGYPCGRRGEDIPLESRIVTFADVYDALLSERVYKTAMSEEEALDAIRRERGRILDPGVCDAFEDVTKEFRTIRSDFADDPVRCAELECLP